jgi:hypothetical protein
MILALNALANSTALLRAFSDISEPSWGTRMRDVPLEKLEAADEDKASYLKSAINKCVVVTTLHSI